MLSLRSLAGQVKEFHHPNHGLLCEITPNKVKVLQTKKHRNVYPLTLFSVIFRVPSCGWGGGNCCCPVVGRGGCVGLAVVIQRTGGEGRAFGPPLPADRSRPDRSRPDRSRPDRSRPDRSRQTGAGPRAGRRQLAPDVDAPDVVGADVAARSAARPAARPARCGPDQWVSGPASGPTRSLRPRSAARPAARPARCGPDQWVSGVVNRGSRA